MARFHIFISAALAVAFHGGCALALMQTRGDAAAAPKPNKTKKRVELPNVTDRLSAVDKATSSIEALVHLVNDTTVEALGSAVDAGRGLYTALLQAKETTGGLDIVVGKEASSKGVVLFERLSYTLEAHPSEAAEAEERMQLLLHDILRSFRSVGQESRNSFIAAQDSADHITRKERRARHSRVTFLQELRKYMRSEVDMAGVIDWIRSSWSEPGTPCEEARANVARADKSVEHMRHMLLTVNASLCTSMLEGAQQSIGAVASLLREEMVAGKSSYAMGLPKSLLSTVGEAVEQTIDVMERTMASTSAAKDQVAQSVKQNMDQLRTLHAESNKLNKYVMQECSKQKQ